MNLLISYGYGEPQRIALDNDDQGVLIGRSRVVDVIIEHSHVSRIHTKITRVGDDTFRVEDMKSANGTFLIVNDVPFPINDGTVKAGAVISLGQYVELTILPTPNVME